MERTRILVICENGGTGLMSSMRDIWGEKCANSFQIAEEFLPDARDADLSVILPLFFARCTPHVMILCLSEHVLQKTEAIFEVIGKNGWEIPVLLALQTADAADLMAMLKLGAADFVLAPFRAQDLVPRLRRLLRAAGEAGSPTNEIKLQLGLEKFVGESSLLHAAIRQIPKLA